MYQVIYIPRIQDEIVIAQSDDLISIYKFMDRIRNENPQSYKHHYIWDTNNETKMIN
jgi:hypothetical protein